MRVSRNSASSLGSYYNLVDFATTSHDTAWVSVSIQLMCAPVSSFRIDSPERGYLAARPHFNPKPLTLNLKPKLNPISLTTRPQTASAVLYYLSSPPDAHTPRPRSSPQQTGTSRRSSRPAQSVHAVSSVLRGIFLPNHRFGRSVSLSRRHLSCSGHHRSTP